MVSSSPPSVDFDKTALVQAAITAAQRAYVPYSNYRVGAALLSQSGEVFLGCNVENAAYPECICAERTAVVKAVSEGHLRFQAIAVATENIGQPCGACRQVLREFAPQLIVILADFEGQTRQTSLAALLPDSFGPEKLD